MNYLYNINGFNNISALENFSANIRSLYFALLEINNAVGWKEEEFKCKDTILKQRAGLRGNSAVNDARNTLKQYGLIDFRMIGKGKALYTISPFGKMYELKARQLRKNDGAKAVENRKKDEKNDDNSIVNWGENQETSGKNREENGKNLGDIQEENVQNSGGNSEETFRERRQNKAGDPLKLNQTKLNQTKLKAIAKAGEEKEKIGKVIEVFEEKIHKISQEREAEILADLIEEHGTDKVLAVIEHANESCQQKGEKVQSIKYLVSILQRWKKDEYQTPLGGKNNGSDSYRGSTTEYDIDDPWRNKPCPWRE